MDLKTTLGPLRPIATFSNLRADHFRHQAFHRQTHTRMLPSQCRKRTSDASDDVAAVCFHVRHRTQLLVQHLARRGCSRTEVSSWSFSTRQLVSESLTGLSKHRLQLTSRETVREYIYQLRKERNVSARQQLFHFRREFEYV